MKEPVFMDKLGFCQQLSMKSAVFMDKPDRRCVPATPASLLIPAAAGCSLQKPTGLLTEALTTPNRGWHVASNTSSVRFLNRSAKNYFAAEIKRFSTSDLFIAPSMHMNCISFESPAINTKLSIMFSSPAV